MHSANYQKDKLNCLNKRKLFSNGNRTRISLLDVCKYYGERGKFIIDKWWNDGTAPSLHSMSNSNLN